MSRDTKIKDIKRILSEKNKDPDHKYFVNNGSEGCIPKNRDMIIFYADEPCVEACQLLYDLNIRTFSSGANVDGEENAKDMGFIGIDYDSLSDENKKIAQEMEKNRIINKIKSEPGRNYGLVFNIEVPINSNSLVGEVSDKLVELASNFQQQDVLYGRKSIDEIKSSIFSKLDNDNYRNNWTFEVITKEEMQQSLPEWVEYECENMYTSDKITYFLSEDLLNKHNEYIKSFNNSKHK